MGHPLFKAALHYAFFINASFNAHKQSWQVGIELPIFQREWTLRNAPWLSGVTLQAVLTLVWWMLKLEFFFPRVTFLNSEDFPDKEIQLSCPRFNLNHSFGLTFMKQTVFFGISDISFRGKKSSLEIIHLVALLPLFYLHSRSALWSFFISSSEVRIHYQSACCQKNRQPLQAFQKEI